MCVPVPDISLIRLYTQTAATTAAAAADYGWYTAISKQQLIQRGVQRESAANSSSGTTECAETWVARSTKQQCSIVRQCVSSDGSQCVRSDGKFSGLHLAIFIPRSATLRVPETLCTVNCCCYYCLQKNTRFLLPMAQVLNYHDAVVYDTDVGLFGDGGWLNDNCINWFFR